MIKPIYQSSKKLQLYTDAATTKGFGGVFNSHWFMGSWGDALTNTHITILEMYPIVLALYLWGDTLQNSCVLFHSDNEAVVEILNKQSSKDPTIMILVRRFVIRCLQLNISFHLKHIPGVNNTISDLLSRFQVREAKILAPHLDEQPSVIHPDWELSNWLQNP